MEFNESTIPTDLKLEQVEHTEMIVPIEPTDNRPFRLSTIDQSLVFPVETIRFFAPDPHRPVTDLVSTLRDALGKVLVPYHFLAGRLRRADSERLEVDCNRNGAHFTHYKSGLRLADLGDLELQNPVFRQLVPHDFGTANILSAPLLAIQVTIVGGLINRVTTFDVLAAHVWLARTKAVELPDETPFHMLFAVDIRKIMKPALPENYAGNAVSNACARATPKQVKKYSFPEAVQAIQQATARVTDDYVRSSLDYRATKKAVPGLFGGFVLVAWYNLLDSAADYGWGEAVYAGPCASSRTEFVLLLSNFRQVGGVNLKISLLPEQMERFQSLVKVEDPEHLQCSLNSRL